jgi:hypothetical protein
MTSEEMGEALKVLRKEILDKTTVKDLRSSWILSGYDGELKEDGEFIFKNDYTFAKDSANSLAFQGDVKFLAEDHHGAKSYSVTSIDTLRKTSNV